MLMLRLLRSMIDTRPARYATECKLVGVERSGGGGGGSGGSGGNTVAIDGRWVVGGW
jgi:hypothetical protein